MNTYLLHKAICKYIKLSVLMQGYDYFRIPRNTLCLPPKLVMSSNALRKMHYSQEHLKTMVHAKFGGKQSVLRGIRK